MSSDRKSSSASSATLRTKGKERLDVLKEVISTETTYVNNLKTLRQIYEEPLSLRIIDGHNTSSSTDYACQNEDRDFYERFDSEKMLIHRRDFIKIFNDLLPIRALNEKMLTELVNHYEQTQEFGKKPDQALGDIFLKYAPWFKTYTAYTNQYNSIATLLRGLRKENRDLDHFLNTIKNKHPRSMGLSIESYLIQPVQRIPRYNLLLKEIIKKTSEYHRDYESLEKASEVMKSVADYVNMKIKEFEYMLRMNEIDSMITYTMELKCLDSSTRDPLVSPLILPSRLFKHEVDNCKVTINGDAMPLPNDQSCFILYIFNDILLWFRKLVLEEPVIDDKSSQPAKKHIITEFCGVIHLEAEKLPWCYINVISDEKPHTAFTLVTEGKAFTFEFVNEDEMIKCIKVILEGLEDTVKSRKKTVKNMKRPMLPFVKPAYSDPFSMINANIGAQLQRVSSNGSSSGSPVSTKKPSLSIFSKRRKSGSLTSRKSTESTRKSLTELLRPRSKSLTFEPIDSPKKTVNPYFVEREDFPSRVVQIEATKDQKGKQPDVEKLSLSDEALEKVRKSPDSQCIGACVSSMNFVVEDPATLAKDEFTFRKGDIFLVYDKIVGVETIWYVCKKPGLNCDPAYKELLQNERKFRTHSDLVKEMKSQRSKKRIDASSERPNDKLLRRMTNDQLIMVDERLWSDLISPDEKLVSTYLNMELIEQSVVAEAETKTTTIPKSSSMRSLKATAEKLKLAKSEERKNEALSLLQATSLSPSQEEQILSRIVNLYREYGQVGLIPSKYVQDISPGMQKKLLALVDMRNYDEDRKVRNFVRPSTLSNANVDLRASVRNSRVYKPL